MMGHNPTTHHRQYGKWTDEAGLEEAVARAMGKSVIFKRPATTAIES